MKAPSTRGRTLRGALFALAALLVALVVVGCGSGDSESGGGGGEGSGDSGKPVKMAMSVPGPNLYFDNWDNALGDLNEEFGFESHEYAVGTQWSLNAQNVSLNALMGKGYNAIGLFPGDPEATNTQIQQMGARGATSILIGGCTNDPSEALFCIATDVKAAAYDAAKHLIERMGGKGKIAHLSSMLTDPNTELRKQGVEEAVAETDGAVEIVQFIGDTDVPDQAPKIVDSLLASKGDQLSGIVATAWYPTEALAAAFRANPEYQDKITVIGEDASMVTMKAIRDGIIEGTEFQNSYGQAYVGGYVLQKVVGEGCELRDDIAFDEHPQTKRFIDSGWGLIDESNVEEYFDMADEKGVVPETLPEVTKEIMAKAETDWLDCPAG